MKSIGLTTTHDRPTLSQAVVVVDSFARIDLARLSPGRVTSDT
jgi:hypothetical protein